MRYRIVPAAAALAVALSLPVLVAQSPAPPVNLRLTLGDAKPPAPSPCIAPKPGGSAHAYFDTLVQRPEHYCNWSLRSQAQLDSLVGDPVATNFSYSPSTDFYADKQDAAKFVLLPGGPSSLPAKQQLHLVFKPSLTSGSILITWDWYWGREFRENRGAVNHYKMFQVMMGGHGWWTLMSTFDWASPTDTKQVGMAADSFRAGTLADGAIQREPWTPSGPGTPDQRNKSGSQYPQLHSVWTRYWIEIKMLQPPSAFTEWSQTYLNGAPLGPNLNDPEGRWHMVSLWMADEKRDARRLLYRVPINYDGNAGWNPWISRFRFELNTSQPANSLTGPLIGYARNMVVLHNYELPAVAESDTFIFRRPGR